MAGEQVQWFASQLGWPLKRFNVLVEGETDREYFLLADRLHRKEFGRALLGGDIAVFPTGRRKEGGTFGLIRYFPTLRQLIDLDVDGQGRTMFRAIALVDGDWAGKSAVKLLTSKYTRFVLWRDVFLVQRSLPRRTRDVRALALQVEVGNQRWRRWDCTIEDLIDYQLLLQYRKIQTKAITRLERIPSGEHEVRVSWEFKRDLSRFCWEHCSYQLAIRHVELLKSLRFYLGLAPDGDLL